MPNPIRTPDEAAREWVANYYGSIDTTALLLAFKAGAKFEADAERASDLCTVCAGAPLASGRPCVCGGEGTADAERRGLRLYAFSLEDDLARARAAADELLKEQGE